MTTTSLMMLKVKYLQAIKEALLDPTQQFAFILKGIEIILESDDNDLSEESLNEIYFAIRLYLPERFRSRFSGRGN